MLQVISFLPHYGSVSMLFMGQGTGAEVETRQTLHAHTLTRKSTCFGEQKRPHEFKHKTVTDTQTSHRH